MRAIALRYALAPACVLLAVLLHLSPAGAILHPTGLFAIAVLAAAWFGGAGPGLLAAVLATFTLPQIIAMSYPLLGGFLDLPRFVTFTIAGLAVGWWSLRRRQVEEALRESEKRHELAMNASKDGFWDWFPAGDKLHLSPRLLEVLGFQPGTRFAGRRAMFERLSMPQEDRAALDHAVAEHFAGETARMELEFRILVAGEVRWIHCMGLATRNAAGEVVRWTGAARDITDLKRAEDALQLSEQKRRQTQRLEAMGSLAGGIAHDFNNILGAILGYGEMALRDAPPGTRLRRDLESILTAGERGRALVDRVLTFSRSGIGDRIPVHVEKVVRDALDLLAGALRADINLEVNLEAGTAAMVGAPTQVHQIVIDLATNGIQSMPTGGRLHVSLKTQSFDSEHAATVGTVGAADYLLLKVADSGTGIEPSILEHIFEPFFTTKEVNVGNGLGLALVHGIVMDVGGAIDVVSTPGSGSTFTVYLPRTGDAPGVKLEPEEHLPPRGHGERILVVDDEEPLVRLTTERLVDLGYQAVGFTSSAAAIEAFRADPNGFDAVITDERMPEMSGSQLIREVRAIRRAVPILLISGYVGGMVTRRAYNEGADEVLKKPLSEQDLATSLARVFRK